MSLWSWGAGSYGQLGTGLVADSFVPLKASTVTSALQQVCCGGNHVAAISGTSCVVWGSTKASGACGASAGGEVLAPLTLPANLFGREQVQAVSAGWCHTAFVTVTGKLFTAGEGAFGQLGLGNSVQVAAAPVRVIGELATCRVHQVACGMHHTLVLGQVQPPNCSHLHAPDTSRDLALSIFAFGANRRGQAGIKAPQSSSTQQLQAHVQSNSLAGAEQQCTAPPNSRQSKHSSTTANAVAPSKVWEPCLVADLQHRASPSKVLAGGHHSGVIDTSGCLHLWGRSYTSQANLFVPEQITAIMRKEVQMEGPEAGCSSPSDDRCHKWIQVSLGWSHVLALDDKGCVWAWGSNRYGQCGQPTDQTGQVSYKTAAHDRQGSYASLSRESANSELVRQPTQVQAPDMQCVIQTSAGSEHSAVVTADGRVFAWGWGEHGQLGIGSTQNLSQPNQVQVPACKGVFCGSGFTVALQAK